MKAQTLLITAVAVVIGLFVWERFLRSALVRQGQNQSFDYEQIS
ncbi:MAG: hypothetical protein N3E49_09465 [Bacteroidia bacterium]|nr:hypothetical protein [Bacteroidia bacterium]